MYKEPESMREVHKIRLQIHEEMKNFTIDEKVAYIHKTAQDAIKKYGIKIRKN